MMKVRDLFESHMRNVWGKTIGWIDHQVAAGRFFSVHSEKEAQELFDYFVAHDIQFGFKKGKDKFSFYFDSKNANLAHSVVSRVDKEAATYFKKSVSRNYIDDNDDDDDDDDYDPDKLTSGDVFTVRKSMNVVLHNDKPISLRPGDDLIFYRQNRRFGKPANDYIFKIDGQTFSLTASEIDSYLKVSNRNATAQRREQDDKVID